MWGYGTTKCGQYIIGIRRSVHVEGYNSFTQIEGKFWMYEDPEGVKDLIEASVSKFLVELSSSSRAF